MRQLGILLSIALVIAVGCEPPTPSDPSSGVTTIEGTGEQFISLKLPGMT